MSAPTVSLRGVGGIATLLCKLCLERLVHAVRKSLHGAPQLQRSWVFNFGRPRIFEHSEFLMLKDPVNIRRT